MVEIQTGRGTRQRRRQGHHRDAIVGRQPRRPTIRGVLLTAPRFDGATVAAALGVPDVAFLGSGAFGDTWRTDDRAVKIICVDGYPPVRVAREVAGLTRVRSPNVVRLFDAKTVSLGGKDFPALVFEYVPGGDIQQAIDGGRCPQPGEAFELLAGLLQGVSELHRADGTVHRDIKPANIALRNGAWDQPVLLDLGLARSNTETTVTVYPGLIGTTAYMAPEQLEGRRARKAADLFAVGVSAGQQYSAGIPTTIPAAATPSTRPSPRSRPGRWRCRVISPGQSANRLIG